MPICLHIIYGCLCTVMAECSDCKGANDLQNLKYFLSGPQEKNMLTSALEPHLEKSFDIFVLNSLVLLSIYQ